MNCANCNAEIYWDHKDMQWGHISDQWAIQTSVYKIYCDPFNIRHSKRAEPKIDDKLRKVCCEHCEKPIYKSGFPAVWVHHGERHSHRLCGPNESDCVAEPKEETKAYCIHCKKEIADSHGTWMHTETGSIHCVLDLSDGIYRERFAEPEHDLIILDEVKAEKPIVCNKCIFRHVPKYKSDGMIDFLCGVTGWEKLVGEYRRFEPIPPPDWCPLKAKEPEKVQIFRIGQTVWMVDVNADGDHCGVVSGKVVGYSIQGTCGVKMPEGSTLYFTGLNLFDNELDAQSKWNSLKVATTEAEKAKDLCLATIQDPALVCELPGGHVGQHKGKKDGFTYNWNDYDGKALFELTVNAPESPPKIELKRRSLDSSIKYLIDKYDRKEINKDWLVYHLVCVFTTTEIMDKSEESINSKKG